MLGFLMVIKTKCMKMKKRGSQEKFKLKINLNLGLLLTTICCMLVVQYSSNVKIEH